MNIERITREIRQAYGTHTTQHGRGAWMSAQTIANRTDLTFEEIKAGILHLARTDDTCNVIPESAQHTLTPLDRALEVWHGGQMVHLIGWN